MHLDHACTTLTDRHQHPSNPPQKPGSRRNCPTDPRPPAQGHRRSHRRGPPFPCVVLRRAPGRPGRHAGRVPEELYGVLRDVVNALSQGMAISIVPHNTMLTTQEAADTLLRLAEAAAYRPLWSAEVLAELR